VPQHQLRGWNARFVSMAFPGDTITCRGVITETSSENDENRVKLDISVENQKGENILVGTADISII
jgi:acyl dehydratase